jgi:hypothetical protein
MAVLDSNAYAECFIKLLETPLKFVWKDLL